MANDVVVVLDCGATNVRAIAVDTQGKVVAKGVLPLTLFGPANYGYRSALLSRPALVLQVAGPALYGVALAESATLALALSSGLCLVMFVMTFGLQTRPKPQQEHAAA